LCILFFSILTEEYASFGREQILGLVAELPTSTTKAIFFLEPTVAQYHFYDACYVENTRFSAKFFKAVFIFCCQQHGYFNTFTKALLKYINIYMTIKIFRVSFRCDALAA